MVMMRLKNEKKTQTRAVFCQLRMDPSTCTKSIPNACVKETVVRKAPLFFGLAYSPMRIDRRGESIPIERPWSILPTSKGWKENTRLLQLTTYSFYYLCLLFSNIIFIGQTHLVTSSHHCDEPSDEDWHGDGQVGDPSAKPLHYRWRDETPQ